MSKIIFTKEPLVIYDCDFLQFGSNQVRLSFINNVPNEEAILSGFNIVNEHNGHIQTIREDYKYLYREYDDKKIIELCNNNIPWVKPKYTIQFICDIGGNLEGELEQEVYNFEELNIPTVNTETGYEFIEWDNEIPSEGTVEKDMVFRAVIVDKNVYFYSNGNGHLEGNTKQYITDYSELVIPSIIADDGYKFIAWSPEVPTSGEIDSGNNHFYAIFESNIPDRLNVVEGDVTSTQLALTEVYETTINNSQQLTDIQMALTEIYEQTLALANK